MKKYLQYNSTHFRETPSDVGINLPHRQTPEARQNEARCPVVLDLSGRPSVNPVSKVTDQKGANEQEAALDLSKYGRQESQEEALDLSKPSGNNQSYPPTHSVNQSRSSIHTPPVTRHSKSPASQPYSLLQAALNSSQPNAGLHTVFDRICQSTAAMLEQRAMIFSTAGMPLTDYGRSIKPFSSLSSRPLGITMPHMSHNSGAVIQGIHKPIAITTPQPHNASVNTKSQSVSEATVSVTDASQSIPSTSNQGYSVSQSNYTSGLNSQISRQLNSGKIGSVDSLKYSPDSLKDPDMVERYLIQPPKGLNHFVGKVNVIPTEALAGFSCSQCSKSFKTKAALKLHTTVHKTAEERQYVCTICSRRFLHRHHLVVHQRKHSGEKPFKCTACSKTFMAIFLLHKHLRKHARETGPVSQISTEQLKQLHDKKLLHLPATQPGPGLNTGQAPSDSPVIVLDDDEDVVNATAEIKVNEEEGKLDRKRYERNKNQSILDMIEKDPNMILEKLKEDFIKSKSETENSNEVKAVNEEKVEMTNNLKLDNEHTVKNSTEKPSENKNINTDIISDSENCEKQKFQEDTDFYIKSEDVNSTYNYIIKDNYEDMNEGITEKETTKQEESQDVKNEINEEENCNLLPEYGSDDEVELDFITGELKVIGKKSMNEDKFGEVKNENEIADDKIENFEVKETAKNILEGTHKECLDSKGDIKEIADVNETKSEDTEMIEKVLVDKDSKTEEEAKSVFELENVEYNKELEKWEKVKADFEKATRGDTVEEKRCEKSDKKKNEHESGNIFEKISEMKDGLKKSEELKEEAETLKDDTNEVNRDVEAILGVIKQKLCEGEESLGSLPKKPKLDECNEIKTGMKLSVTAQYKSDCAESLRQTAPKHARHRKGKKKGKKVKCEICSRSFHSDHYLVLHMAVHKRNPMLQSLKKAKDYQMKAMGFLNKTNVTCEICKKVFKFQKSLNSHMRVHSEKMIQTKLYRKAFRDFMAEAAPHSLRTTSTDKEKSHTQNGESESQMRRLSAGEQIHNRETTASASVKRVSCDIEIMNTFKDEQFDEPPIRVIIGDDNIKRYLCHACDNTYTTRQKLRMHALIHKDNCFLCDVCGKSFFRHITLEKHISTHRLPRPHICDVCKKSFIHRSSLMRHKVIHEKPAIPSIKQQVADINFEMKMLDTYTMLRHERMQKIQMQKNHDTSKTDPVSVKTDDKYDPLDLTVRVKIEDLGLPPVLSPVSAGVPNVTHTSTWNLSPPLITHETSSDIGERTPEHTDVTKNNETESKTLNFESVRPLGGRENHKRRTESTCSESDTVAVEGHQVVQKRSRKTRVYQTSCRVCKEVFPNVMQLKSHMVVHNTVETHLYECHICRHRFTQSCSLLRHLKTSCQENRMKCVPCGRTFHRRNTFDQHMRLHQGGPPNLDGSFYDKRLDEAEVVEERESDIENNNLSKMEGAVINQDTNITPLRLELINILEKETTDNVTVIKQDGIDSDSDARTYLYSEGEVHSRYNSDFSDNDWSPPQSPKKPSIPQDLSITSGNMTLNLLSAVCSDIRNAEKEQELKRKELEEKQKELETIEILANLKRGAMHKSVSSSSSVPNVYHVASPFVSNCDKVAVPSNTHSETVDVSQLENSQFQSNFQGQNIASENIDNGNKMNPMYSSENLDSNIRSSLFPPEPKPSTPYIACHSQKLPSVIEGNSSSTSEPKIPTVVLEVTAEAERKRRQRVESTWQDKSYSALNASPNLGICGPHSVSAIPPSSAWSPLSVSSTPHSVASGPHSAPVFPHSSAINPNLSPFIPHSTARGPYSSSNSPHQAVSSSCAAPVVQNTPGRVPHSTSSPHPPRKDSHSSRETTLHQEMSQMKMHYPAIQERLSLLMKAQVSTSASGSSQSTSAQNPKALDRVSSSSSTTSARAPPVKNLQNSDSDTPQDLSLKKTSQEHLSAHSMPNSRSFYSRSLSTDLARSSHIETKSSPETSRTFPPDMLLHLTKEKKSRSESLKTLPSETARPLSIENKPNIPRSESSKSLPGDVPRSVTNEEKRSESVPVQHPLVPMLQCDLCSRVLYNKTDLHLHMMEHGRSAGALYKMLHSNKALLEQKRPSAEAPIDFTKAGPSNGYGQASEESKVIPPHSLDLSSKKSENQLKAFNLSASQTPENSPGTHSVLSAHKVAEKLSPVSSSDLSDSLPSPSTPSGSTSSAANLDALRQELRLKIYARRRSQGLDDLKVEFKPPEPTEMTESEKLKLMYRRECNRQAAQRSRMRKKDLVDSLLEKLSEMPNVNQKEKKTDP
ncbi:uncharacterized protein LOC123531403 isoform X2 [Mercenaria mercenaria]|uniref:uncharacterized protein LOC123531403 isoform X2 n=1 Tax=Mercenaria mercenaria TaxID=6596 RepID=UPI00234EE0FC|nr:uncharacterized protein LOC123531403 isoform X2 [Mercenaria mercenaria]